MKKNLSLLILACVAATSMPVYADDFDTQDYSVFAKKKGITVGIVNMNRQALDDRFDEVMKMSNKPIKPEQQCANLFVSKLIIKNINMGIAVLNAHDELMLKRYIVKSEQEIKKASLSCTVKISQTTSV